MKIIKLLFLFISSAVFSVSGEILADSSRTTPGNDEFQKASNAYYAQDYAETMKWSLRAAEKRNSTAEYGIGTLYFYGQGVAKNYEVGMKWIRKSAKHGNADAQKYLAEITKRKKNPSKLLSGTYAYEGWKAQKEGNNKQALDWYQKASSEGNDYAEARLGYLYAYGEGVTQDFHKAMYWYQKAAANGNAFAEAAIGYLYFVGQGVPQDFNQTMYWYQKAAAKGNDYAELHVGDLYRMGNGVTADYKKAKIWYQKAATKGNKEAQKHLEELNYSGQAVAQPMPEEKPFQLPVPQ